MESELVNEPDESLVDLERTQSCILYGMDKHFSVHETSTLTGASAHTLRYYERIGLIDGVLRTPSGRRAYSAKDIEWITFLSFFRAMGMSIQEMHRFADLKRAGIQAAPERKAFLERYRDQLLAHIHERERMMKLVELKLAVLSKKIEANDQEADSIDFEQFMNWRRN